MKNEYEHMALFVNIESGEVVLAFGAEIDDGKYQIGEPAEDADDHMIPLTASTKATGIETIYAHTSPGCRYIKVGGSWKRVCT